jgi:tRNA-Thr(GGU) m(6)t(6)A37 methyltransferase TsaA
LHLGALPLSSHFDDPRNRAARTFSFVRFTFEAIGIVRSPFTEKMQAPRQAAAKGGDVEGTIELFIGLGFEDALESIETWSHLWILYAFHQARGWKPKVLPPRSATKRGVFATRSPHRPNPIGMTVVKLLGVDGLVLRVRGLDMLDGTPVLDIKPYVSYADARPRASKGWLDEDEDAQPWNVCWSERARGQAEWLRERHSIDLIAPVAKVLALGPQPHAYRRIRREGEGFRLAYKEWRLRFEVEGRSILITEITTGYRPRELALSDDEQVWIHRAFVERFGGLEITQE